jgi:outer membrane protein TolC
MKKFGNNSAVIIMFISLLFSTVTQAQNSLQLTAKEAVDLALKNVYVLKNARLDYSRQEAVNKEITGQAYPQINGSVTANRFFSIPVTAIPDFISPSVYQVLEQNNVQDGSGAPIKSPGNFGIFPAQFGVPWTASAGFTFQQLLFQPDVFVGLQARQTALDFAKNNVEMVEDSVKANVYNAYYAVLIAQKQITFTNESIARLEKLVHDQEIMYKNGFLEKLEVNRTQVNLTNLRTTENRLQNLSRMGKAALKLTMGISQNDSLILKDTLSTEVITAGLLDNSGFKYEDRSEIRLLTTAARLQELNVKRHRLSYVPTVAAFWNYSQNAQRLKFNFFDTNEKWFPTSIVGLTINVPIFDGFQKKYRIRQARIDFEQTGNDLANLKNVVDFQQESARIQLSNAIASLNLQQNNIELAQLVFNTSRKKFEEGVGSNFELLQAETDLQTAQSNYFQALYDATIARTAYLRALGRL